MDRLSLKDLRTPGAKKRVDRFLGGIKAACKGNEKECMTVADEKMEDDLRSAIPTLVGSNSYDFEDLKKVLYRWVGLGVSPAEAQNQ